MGRDQALIERCQRGDRRALEELLQQYQRPVFNVALRMLGNSDDAADITQTVFLKAFENLDHYNPEHKFFSWIYRIAINESINQINREKRTEPLDDSRPGSGPGPADN
ncbi:MAG: sigma-70 family RNA polymerase sigma factor, partial [Xanthomonadales bacterium]|nr:sigma-70 family RNA polymerase sigma factor [Xanthomonadales bacterium]